MRDKFGFYLFVSLGVLCLVCAVLPPYGILTPILLGCAALDFYMAKGCR